MLANGCRIFNQSQEKLFAQIDESERLSVFQLIDVLGALRTPIFSNSDVSLRLKVVEMATTLVSSYSLLLIYVCFTQNDAAAATMWGFLTQALEDRAWEVSMLIVDYWVDAKDVMAHAIADLKERPWLLEVMKQHAMGISQHCLYSSEEQAWDRVDAEEMTVNKYRASAQEALGAIVSFYSDAKATEELLAVFAPLAQGTPCAQELFLFAMRAFLPTLTETSHHKYLQQVRLMSGYSVRFVPV